MQKINKSYRRNLHYILTDHIPEQVVEANNFSKSWKYGYNEEYDVVIISKNGTIGQIIVVNDLKIALPQQPKQIKGYNIQNHHQKWKRYEVPKELMFFDKYYKDESNIDSILNSVYRKHMDFITNDIDRIENGTFFMNDGEPIYVTGFHYFFLQHYLLTNMRRYGDFRMPQRDYFIWLEACFADERCLGSLLLKARRSYFSTSSGSIILCDSILTKNAFFPIVSKKDKDAQTLFSDHIIKPLNALPKHLQPQRTGEVSPKQELFFSAPKKKITTNQKATSSGSDGLNTLVTFYSTTIDAYDGTQVHKSINDEIGKLKGNLDINEYWDQAHKMCHIVGSKVVGKAICGSTANPPNQGGKNYDLFYNNSKLVTRGKTGQTKTGLYSIFIPADYSLYGYCDEYGYAVIDNPEQPIKNEIGDTIKDGAKSFLDQQELACEGNLKKLNSQKRNNPRVDTDAFLDEDATSMYGTEGVVNHSNFLKNYEKTPKYKAQVFNFDLSWIDNIQDNIKGVNIKHTDKGRFQCSWMPPLEMRNQVNIKDGGKRHPVNTEIGAFGVDPYQSDRAKYGTGSKQGFCGLTKDNEYLLSQNERNKVFLYYNHRPDTIEEAIDDVIKAMVYFSMPVLPETNKDKLVTTLYRRGYRGYVLEDPTKLKSELSPDGKKFGGIYSIGDTVNKQEEALNSYIVYNINNDVDEDDIKIPYLRLLEELQIYTGTIRTRCDSTVALQLAVLANTNKYRKKQPKTEETVTEYDIMDLFKTANNT